MDVIRFEGGQWKTMMNTENWRIGFLGYGERFSKFAELERHNKTDEAFMLLSGTAILYENETPAVMEKGVVYNIPRGTWHHIVVSEDAVVIVVENSDTSMDNSERISLEEYRKGAHA